MNKIFFALPILTMAVAGAVNTQAAVLDIASMDITGGTFEMAGVTSGPVNFGCSNGDPNCAAPVAGIVPIGPNTNLVGGYIGNGGNGIPSSAQDPNTIVGFQFFGAPVNTYTAASNLGDDNSPAGGITGGPVPTGSADDVAGTIMMDVSSWFANWNGTDFNQGNASASGTWDPVTGDYSMTWDSLIVGGPFNGFTGTWVLEGNATVVPIPAAVWLLGSGLLGLVGVARRQKN